MNWHANCTHACTCTTSHHNTNSEFARSLPGAAAKAGGHRAPSSPRCLPATYYYRQHGSTHERGSGVPELGMLSRASIPADGRRGHVHSFVAYPVQEILPLSGLRELGAGFGRRPFLAEGGGSNPRLAINIKPTRCGHFECVSQRLPSHRLNSLRYGPEPKRDGAQKNGNGSQEDGVS